MYKLSDPGVLEFWVVRVAYNYRPMYKLSDPGVLEFWLVRVAYTAVLVEIVSQLSPEPILLRCPCSAADPHLDLVLGPTDDRPDVIVVGFLGLVDPSVWTRQLAVHHHPATVADGVLKLTR